MREGFWPFCVASAPPNLPEPPWAMLGSLSRQDETADLDDGVEVFDS